MYSENCVFSIFNEAWHASHTRRVVWVFSLPDNEGLLEDPPLKLTVLTMPLVSTRIGTPSSCCFLHCSRAPALLAFFLLQTGRSPPPFSVVKSAVPLSSAALSKSFLQTSRACTLSRSLLRHLDMPASPSILPGPRRGSSAPSCSLC